MPAILRGGGGAGPGARFRRDPRALDEEEEMYFDQEEDYEDADPVGGATGVHLPITDMIKTKIDSDLDQISRFLERNKSPGGGHIQVALLKLSEVILWVL